MHQLTIDVGTTQIKFTHFINKKEHLANKFKVNTYYEKDGKVYQKPAEILESIKEGIEFFVNEKQIIDEIYFSTAMHSIMPVYERNTKEEMFIWLDQRSSKWVEAFKKTEKASEFYQKTGTPIHEMSPFCKIGYAKDKKKFNDVKQWIGLKEYLMDFFTNQLVVDYSVASATGLFNSLTKEWDEEILTFLEIEEEKLASLVDTNWSTTISSEIAKELQLSPATKIFVGASDGCLASLGSYAANGTVNTVTIGTSGAVRKLSKTRELDPSGQSFCYYITDEYWVVGGATNNGGKVLEWTSDLFYSSDSVFNHLDDILKKSPIGSRGVQFLPYISGERAPLWTSNVTGEFLGLRLGHDKEDFIRSVIEGILLNAKWIGEIINLDKRAISLSGGFFEDDLLVELAADILGRKCLISSYTEPSYGLLCLTSSLTDFRVLNSESIFYNEENNQLYEEYYQKFVKTVKTNNK
ncbi:gluconokinase [Vagococcus fluvialis]|uniref:gluconokinase n=1 Tax=Vagococcus fluvialis TaxID=2738 RepID=UPI003B2274A4